MSSYVVLARRLRPRSFASLVGQSHVTRALVNALELGRVPHAFLFSGTRGVGKTTLARLLAMCLNCAKGITSEPCGQCPSCLEITESRHPDVFEIDAASRTKVDQMREVLDMVGYAPVSSAHKIFILDEIHMLSSQSFNALLKTLEEPPEHIKFIFATTEPRKIPPTILSRCQRYDLKRIPQDEMTRYLVTVLEKESIPFDELGLAAVVRAAEGSMRDGLSILDQVISHGDSSVLFETVKNLLGLTDREGILKLQGLLLSGQGPEALKVVNDFYNNGVEPEMLVRGLLETIHQSARKKVLGSDDSVDGPSLEHFQMVYQVLLRGSRDLGLAEDALQALEMLILRVTYLKPVPDLEKLMASLKSGGPPTGVVSSPVGVVSTNNKSMGGTSVSMHSSSSTVPSKPTISEKNRVEQLTNWDELISSAVKKDPSLAVKLETQVACLDFKTDSDGEISSLILCLKNDIFGPADRFAKTVEAYIHSLGFKKVRVVVEPASDSPRPQTVNEKQTHQRQVHQSRLDKEIHNHPLVKKMVSRFQAEVVRVEPISAVGV